MNKQGLYLSSNCMGGLYLKDALCRCEEAGIFKVELSAPHPYEPAAKIRKLLAEYRAKGFDFTVHNYFPPQRKDFVLNIASQDGRIRAMSKKVVKEALRLAKEAGSPVYGIHAGYLSDGHAGPDGMFRFRPKKNDYSSSLRQIKEFMEGIAGQADNSGVSIILENLFPESESACSLGSTFRELKEIISSVSEDMGLLLDLGHLNIASHMLDFDKFKFLEQYLSEFGSRLHEVHFSENNGKADRHLPLKKDSWQLGVLKDISAIPLHKECPRIYCLEARGISDLDLLKMNMEMINDRLN